MDNIDFNPRSLAGATLAPLIVTKPSLNFNPRSLAGATITLISYRCSMTNFNPRSLAGATLPPYAIFTTLRISIHAPSRERHNIHQILLTSSLHFNPRSLAGATSICFVPANIIVFQSTLPRGSDLVKVTRLLFYISISIHAPSRERRYCAQKVFDNT